MRFLPTRTEGPKQADLCSQVCRAKSPRSNSGVCFARQCCKPRSQRHCHRLVRKGPGMWARTAGRRAFLRLAGDSCVSTEGTSAICAECAPEQREGWGNHRLRPCERREDGEGCHLPVAPGHGDSWLRRTLRTHWLHTSRPAPEHLRFSPAHFQAEFSPVCQRLGSFWLRVQCPLTCHPNTCLVSHVSTISTRRQFAVNL